MFLSTKGSVQPDGAPCKYIPQSFEEQLDHEDGCAPDGHALVELDHVVEADEQLLHDAPEGELEVLAHLAQVGERRAAHQLVRVRHLPEERVDQLVPEVGFLNILRLFHTTFQPNKEITLDI